MSVSYTHLLDGRAAFAGYSAVVNGFTLTSNPACLNIAQANSYQLQIPSFAVSYTHLLQPAHDASRQIAFDYFEI